MKGLFTCLLIFIYPSLFGQQGIPADSITRLMYRHFEVCNELDSVKRNAALKEVYAPNIYSVDPNFAAIGYQGMINAINMLHKDLPGARLTITGPVETHHNVARFPYSLGRLGENPIAVGWDIVVFDQGRITHIYTFVNK